MIRILKFLFTGNWHVCNHQWERIKEIKQYTYSTDRLPRYTVIILSCKYCGKLKKFRTD